MTVYVDLKISFTPEGKHVFATADGDSAGEVRAAVESIAFDLAGSRETRFRARPEVRTERDFNTKEIHHRGYARFTVFPWAGEWKDAENSVDIGFGTIPEKVTA